MTVRAMFLPGRTTVIFTLSGRLGLALDFGGAPFNTTNQIKIDTDGSMYEGDSVDGAPITYTQLSTTTDWLRPVTNPTTFYARYSNVVGDSFQSTPGAVDTAIAISSDLIWSLNHSSIGIRSTTFDLEILATDQSTVLAGPSAYRVRVENEAGG